MTSAFVPQSFECTLSVSTNNHFKKIIHEMSSRRNYWQFIIEHTRNKLDNVNKVHSVFTNSNVIKLIKIVVFYNSYFCNNCIRNINISADVINAGISFI